MGKNDKEHDPQSKTESPVVKEIVDRVSAISSMTVTEIMVPRIDVVSLPLAASMQELIQLAKEEGHSRIPIWDKSMDDIVGVLYVKDLFPFFFQENPDVDIAKLIRPPYFIPESTKVLSLLKEFRLKKIHLAIVVDEYGGVSGIVSLEDVLEEIVGEIQDEYDEEEALIVEQGENTYLIDSRAYVEDINLSLNLDLPLEHAETIGGLVFALLGRVPKEKESINLDHIELQVDEIDGNRINKIKLMVSNSQLPLEKATE